MAHFPSKKYNDARIISLQMMIYLLPKTRLVSQKVLALKSTSYPIPPALNIMLK